MANERLRYEDRWGPVGAAAFRLIIPVGLLGAMVLLAFPGMFVLPHFLSLPGCYVFLLAAYLILVVLIGLASLRNTALARSSGASVLALIAGGGLTIAAVLFAASVLLSIGWL